MLTAVHHDSRFEVLTNAEQFYPAMLEAIRERPAFDQHGMLHLPARRDRPAVHAGDDGARQGRRRGDARGGRSRELSFRRVGGTRDAQGRLPGRALSTPEVVPVVAAEQPHAPRAPDCRRARGVSRWSRGRRSVVERGARQAAVARHDGAGHRTGRLINPGRLCRELDRNAAARFSAAPRTFPIWRSAATHRA